MTENTNTVTIDNEVINIDDLSDTSKEYLEHIIDTDKQLNILTFKSKQIRITKSAFLTMFNNSRDNKKKE